MSIQFADAGGSKPSSADLAAFANRAKEIDVGGIDDIVELGDDLGISLLTNQNKVSASPKPRQVNFSSSGISDIPSIQIRPVEDLEGVINMDMAPGASDIRINRAGDMDSTPFVINTNGGSNGGNGGNGGNGSSGGDTGGDSYNSISPEDEMRKKQELLTKLRRLENDGLRGQRMTMQNTLAEIKAEYDNLTDSKNLEASIRFQRNALMTFVSGVEMVNDKFGNKLPMKPRLKGWSESVHTNIGDFDDIFEELYDLYKDKTKVHPMLRLVGTLGVSATMFHLTNSMAERSGIPGMADLMNEDPDLQRLIAQKMAAKMGGLGQFMNMASGYSAGGPAPAGHGSNDRGLGPMPMGMGAPPPSPPRNGASGRTPFNASSAAASSDGGVNRARREMRGPVGVDDILKAFENERIMQTSAPSISASHASVFTPSGAPPPSASGVSILREGIGGMSDPMADFMSGGNMDDGASFASGSTMNIERRRGRKRAVATPVGATLDLNV
jgi:hypothetical protein